MKKTQVELESRIIQGAHGVAAEEDHIKTSKVVGIGALALIIFVVGCIWAWRIMVVTMNDVNPTGAAQFPAAMGQYEIGIVNQRLFSQDWHAEMKLGQQEAALVQGHGDKPGVAVHPTLEQAMEQVIVSERQARQQPPQAPAPQDMAPEGAAPQGAAPQGAAPQGAAPQAPAAQQPGARPAAPAPSPQPR